MKLKSKIIGVFSDVPESGKSLFARLLRQHLNAEMGCVVAEGRSFATPLKNTAATLLKEIGIQNPSYYILENKEEPIPSLGITGRKLLQTLGTDYARNYIKQDIWIKAAENAVGKYTFTTFDDLRMPNEMEWLREQGGITIYISRPDAPDLGDDHATEGNLNKEEADIQILNDEGISELSIIAKQVAERIIGWIKYE